MNRLYLQSKNPEVRRKENALPWRQHLYLFHGCESWESLKSKHVVGEHLYSIAVYSTEPHKVTLGWQRPFSQRGNLYSRNVCSSASVGTQKCMLPKEQGCLCVCMCVKWGAERKTMNLFFLFPNLSCLFSVEGWEESGTDSNSRLKSGIYRVKGILIACF